MPAIPAALDELIRHFGTDAVAVDDDLDVALREPGAELRLLERVHAVAGAGERELHGELSENCSQGQFTQFVGVVSPSHPAATPTM